ncbi:AAA family ATPase [Candidatus Woesearchaeota archaeon]|nr:AAA family ATPase [Candidatus Woesearchaeota archaeon]
MSFNKVIIGLTGTNASGKGEVANYLKLKRFQYLSLSDIIREEADAQGIEHTRENLIKLGNELREKHGADVLAKKTRDKIKEENVVVDSIRNLEEVKALRTLSDFIFVAVDAPVKLRYERAQKRMLDRDKVSFEEFKRLEEVENFKSKTGQQLKQCAGVADKTIINDGTFEELHAKIDEIIK